MMPVAQIDAIIPVQAGIQSIETITYLYTDHLMTNRLATNNNGIITWCWEGEAFGNTPAQELSGVSVNLRFPGQYYDSETNLHYNWNRYYDPSLGRYITSDPIGLTAGMNTYSYVGQNPLTRTDQKAESWAAIAIWWGLCSAGSYIIASDAYPNPKDDKKKHCYASCLLNKCMLWSYLPAFATGWGFEQPQRGMAGNVYDERDIDANIHGILASYKGSCKAQCDACPVE